MKTLLKGSSPRNKRSDTGCSKTDKDRNLRSIGRQLRIRPGQTSKAIFFAAGLPDVPEATRNDTLRSTDSVKDPLKIPRLTSKHKILRTEWANKYLKIDMSNVLFTDEARVTLEGPDGWTSGWMQSGYGRHQRFRRQQQGGGVMIWAAIINLFVL